MNVFLGYRADGANDIFLSALPVGLGIMAAVLQAEGVSASVVNFTGDSWRQIESYLSEERPDILALSVFTHNRESSKRLAREAKRLLPDCWIICGGPHASHAVADLFAWPGVDAVAVGEGEEILRDIVHARKESASLSSLDHITGLYIVADADRHQQSRTSRAPIANLDQLPFAHHGLMHSYGVDLRQQAEFIITSRGCPSACVFCSSPNFWGNKIRFRSASSVLQELWSIQHELGLLYFSIRDDTFTADRNRAIEICRRIIDEKLYILWNCQSRVSTVDEELLGWLKRAGCECIQFGIESGSPRILKHLGKRISLPQIRQAVAAARKVGLQVSIYLIAGVPGETAADIAETEALLAEIQPHDGQVSPLVYYPGTALFNEAVATKQVAADLFASSSADAIYVRTDAEVKKTTQRLLACLQRVEKSAAYQRNNFMAQKNVLGYCHATNLQAGEWFVACGRFADARREYEEITQREPENPWGWLALGELALSQNQWHAAADALQKVHLLVPRHLPVLYTLAEVAAATGNRRQATKWLELAETLGAS